MEVREQHERMGPVAEARAAMQENRITQSEAAAVLGMAQSSVSSMVRTGRFGGRVSYRAQEHLIGLALLEAVRRVVRSRRGTERKARSRLRERRERWRRELARRKRERSELARGRRSPEAWW